MAESTLVGGHDDNDSSLDISYMSTEIILTMAAIRCLRGITVAIFVVRNSGWNKQSRKSRIKRRFFNITRPRNIAFNYIVRAAYTVQLASASGASGQLISGAV